MSLAISDDAKKLAVGDDCGKIFVLLNFMPSASDDDPAQLVIQSLPHWHHSAVSSLQFESSSLLMSGGKESVLVQWNLDTDSKSFTSRLGNGEIKNL